MGSRVARRRLQTPRGWCGALARRCWFQVNVAAGEAVPALSEGLRGSCPPRTSAPGRSARRSRTAAAQPTCKVLFRRPAWVRGPLPCPASPPDGFPSEEGGRGQARSGGVLGLKSQARGVPRPLPLVDRRRPAAGPLPRAWLRLCPRPGLPFRALSRSDRPGLGRTGVSERLARTPNGSDTQRAGTLEPRARWRPEGAVVVGSSRTSRPSRP